MQYLPVDVHTCSYVYTHELYYLCKRNLQKVPCGRVYIYTCTYFNRCVHRSNSVQATGFSPTLKVWSQKPPESLSEIEKLKIILGEHAPRPPSLSKSMSSIIFLANLKVLL